jgi:hypothetical protein
MSLGPDHPGPAPQTAQFEFVAPVVQAAFADVDYLAQGFQNGLAPFLCDGLVQVVLGNFLQQQPRSRDQKERFATALAFQGIEKGSGSTWVSAVNAGQ